MYSGSRVHDPGRFGKSGPRSSSELGTRNWILRRTAAFLFFFDRHKSERRVVKNYYVFLWYYSIYVFFTPKFVNALRKFAQTLFTSFQDKKDDFKKEKTLGSESRLLRLAQTLLYKNSVTPSNADSELSNHEKL